MNVFRYQVIIVLSWELILGIDLGMLNRTQAVFEKFRVLNNASGVKEFRRESIFIRKDCQIYSVLHG